MSIQHISTPVAVPFPLPALYSKPQLFTITYDHSKVKTHKDNVWMVSEKLRKVVQEGTVYTNGKVTLDSGVMFESKFQMEEYFAERGEFSIEDVE